VYDPAALSAAPAKLHLDTDIGGDLDDLCALALVLAWPGVELTAVTTVADAAGRRAGYARRALALAGREGVPVAAGADVALGRFRYAPGYPPEARYWPQPVPPAPGPLEAALDLLEGSIEAGAVVAGIGQWTNLSLLETRRPGILRRARLVLMGGHLRPAPKGFTAWGSADDYNVQLDVAAARHVLTAASPILVPLEITVQTALRRAHLPELRRAGPLGALIAHQAQVFGEDWRAAGAATAGGRGAGLPADTLNFQHDPLACAVALGWPGVGIETVPLLVSERDGLLVLGEGPGGAPTAVVTTVDGAAFGDFWLRTVRRLGPAGA
jgi:inosine-uridine nucleoside N-ribohydrolase